MSIKKGIYAASMTLVNEDLSINTDYTVKHSEKLIKQGCHSTVIGGSTGMMQYVSPNEKRKLIDLKLFQLSVQQKIRLMLLKVSLLMKKVQL